jgi:hypothetical protein
MFAMTGKNYCNNGKMFAMTEKFSQRPQTLA